MTPRATTDVLIATRIHSPEAAAAAFRLNAVENAALDAAHRTHVLTTCSVGNRFPEEDQRSPLLHVSRWPALRDASGYVRGYLPYMSFDVPLFFRILFAPRPRVVLVEPPPTTGVVVRAATGLRSLVKKRIPYVWYAADIWSDATALTGAPSFVTHLVRWMERAAMSGAAATIAVSEGVAQRVLELCPEAYVHIIPNGIDTEIFTPEARPLGADEHRAHGITGPFFLYAGTFSEWQGAEIFAQAIARVRAYYPDAQLVFLGQGSSRAEIDRIKREIIAAEESVGKIRKNDPIIQLPLAPATYAARFHVSAVTALVSIKPDCGYDFAYPTKILSALATGTPVIYAGKGPAVEDIRCNNLGWAVEYDVDAVATAMCESLKAALQPSEERSHFEQRGRYLRRWVCDNRSMVNTGQKVVQLLEKVMREAGTA